MISENLVKARLRALITKKVNSAVQTFKWLSNTNFKRDFWEVCDWERNRTGLHSRATVNWVVREEHLSTCIYEGRHTQKPAAAICNRDQRNINESVWVESSYINLSTHWTTFADQKHWTGQRTFAALKTWIDQPFSAREPFVIRIEGCRQNI